MKAFLGFVIKEVRHILRDWRTLMILLGMPMIMMVLFGYAIRNEIRDIKVVVVDLSGDSVTRRLTERFMESPYFVISAEARSLDEIEPLFQRGQARMALVFQPGFGRKLEREGTAQIQLVADAAEPNSASTVLSYATAVIAAFQREEFGSFGFRPGIVLAEVRMQFNPTLQSAFLFVPGLVAILLMLVCALMTSITITREKEVGTMEVLLISPLRAPQIIVGKVLPYMVLSLINVATILVLARFVFNVPVRGSLLLLLAECLLFIFCALSLGILISTKANTQQVAMMASLAGLLLPTILLSGFMFPVSSMPEILQWVSNIVPARWFLIIVRGIMIKGVGLEVLWQETLIIAGMTLFFIALSVRSFKIRLE